MARHVLISIRETLVELQQLENRARDRSEQIRIRSIRMLKERPEVTITEMAAECHCSERAVKRWIHEYREGGIERLRSVGRYCHRLPDQIMTELHGLIALGEFTSVGQVREWLRNEHRIRLSAPAVHAVLARQNAALGHEKAASTSSGLGVGLLTPTGQDRAWADQFRRSLPPRLHACAWSECFNQALRAHLSVDRVSVSLDVRAICPTPQRSTVPLSIEQAVDGELGECSTLVVRIGSGEPRRDGRAPNGTAPTFDATQFHEPVVQDYTYGDRALGTVWVWVLRTRSRPTAGLRLSVARLDDIITSLMIDGALRHEANRPLKRLLIDGLEALINEAGLSDTEASILSERLMGNSYEEIATAHGMSHGAVGRRLHDVYSKCNAHGLSDLLREIFGRFQKK